MENENIHSKAKLALAVFTSPNAAFEEIHRRRLLGTALIIMALTGTLAMIPPIIAMKNGGHIQWLVLGQYNPVAWLGLGMLYTLAMQKLLKWIGAQVDFTELLTLVGWSQLTLLFAELSTIAFSYGTSATTSSSLVQAGVAGILVFSLWYVTLMGSVVQTLSGSPKARGIMTYAVIQIAAFIAFSQTYGSARQSAFQDALPGVSFTAAMIIYADKLPWAAASVIGLVIGVVLIGKHFEWPARNVKINAVAAGFVGLLALGAYASMMSQTDYYGKLSAAQEAYNLKHYEEAAKSFEVLLPISKDNFSLMLDTADTYYLAKKDEQAIDLYQKAETKIEHEKEPNKNLLAQVHVGIGMIYDAQNHYPEAIAEFDKASKAWPEYREPWVRMSVTYDKMGNYPKAIESSDQAIKKLESEATVAWIARGQAFANQGNVGEVKAAMGIVIGRDKKLAARIGANADDWKTAVDKLTRDDLKSPLEAKPAPEPKKPAKVKKK